MRKLKIGRFANFIASFENETKQTQKRRMQNDASEFREGKLHEKNKRNLRSSQQCLTGPNSNVAEKSLIFPVSKWYPFNGRMPCF